MKAPPQLEPSALWHPLACSSPMQLPGGGALPQAHPTPRQQDGRSRPLRLLKPLHTNVTVQGHSDASASCHITGNATGLPEPSRTLLA